MDRITVLMSTYNGERFIREQLDSIFAQENVDVNLIVRDDGSTDSTMAILAEYSKKHPNMKYYQGENKRPAKSFMELIQSNYGQTYYATADQDDVWAKDKLYSAIEFIKKNSQAGEPCLYFSNLNLVDADNVFIRRNHSTPPKYNKYAAFIETIATGCTFVYNKELSEVLHHYDPQYMNMHDVWIYLVANMFGRAVYDFEPHINYRQHGNNVVGVSVKKNRAKTIKGYFKRVFVQTKFHPKEDQAKEFVKGYDDIMTQEQKDIAYKVAFYRKSLKSRIALLCDRKYKSSNFSREIRNRILILLGKL